jgi:type I restriction enzyme R subunit
MPHAYAEDQLVEQLAIGLFAELGWKTVSALEELIGRNRGDEAQLSPAESQSLLTSSPTIGLGRETKGEVVLVSRLRAALERLNANRTGHHALPPEVITAAVLTGTPW